MSRFSRSHNAPTRRNERGAAAVEFAIVLPLLILLVFGIIEFSIAYNNKQGLQAAAREGARIAALPQTSQSDIVAKVDDALSGVVKSTDVTVTVSPNTTHPCDGAQPGTHVVVTVSAPDQLMLPLVSNTTITITGKGEFLCE